ncbi:hypothetical protein BH24PSE2_BH24PSE2_01690 [soil metagenome]
MWKFVRFSAPLATLLASGAMGFGAEIGGPDWPCTPGHGNASACREYISKLEEKNDESRDGRFELAQALFHLAIIVGPTKERREILKKKNKIYEGLLNDFPNDSEIIRKFALTHFDDNATVRLLKKLVTLTPDDSGAHWILGQVLTDSTDDTKIRDGLLHYAQAYEFAAAQRKIGMGSEYIVVLQQLGYRRRASQFLEKMLDDLDIEELLSRASELPETYILQPPPFPNALTRLIDIVCHFKFLHVERSRCDTALQIAVQLQQMFPSNIALADLLVSAYESVISATSTAPDIDEASIRRAYQLRVQHDPDNPLLLRAYGSHLDESEREEVLSQQIDAYSATPAATHAALAEEYWGLEEREEAIRHMYRAFRHDSASYGDRLITMLQEVGRAEEAASVESQLRLNAMD